MSWGRRPGVVLSVAVIASLLAGTAVAVAAEGVVAPRSFTDARDSKSGVDIRTMTTERTDDGRMRYRINTEDEFERDKAPCMRIQAGLKRKAFRICGSGDVVRPDGTKVAKAKVSRPTKRSIVYTFGTKALGPTVSFYRWRAVVLANRCPQGVCDRSPNRGWITFKRRMTYGAWADSFMHELDAPACRNNRIVTTAWLVNEGTTAVWNPLATTYSMPGNTVFNSHGVKNFPNHATGLDASRLTLERGWEIYDYGAIVRKLRHCAGPKDTARAIKRSSWCAGCTNGRYVIGLIKTVKSNLASYTNRLVATAR
ncbi:MAG: hypothetical protein WD556_10760 [Actinomycetota bacterium]